MRTNTETLVGATADGLDVDYSEGVAIGSAFQAGAPPNFMVAGTNPNNGVPVTPGGVGTTTFLTTAGVPVSSRL